MFNRVVIPDDEFYPVKINNSARFSSDNSTVIFEPSNVAKDGILATHSLWIKRSEISTAQYILEGYLNDNERDIIYIDANDVLYVQGISGGSAYYQLITSMKFRDTSNWYHILVHYDRNNATASDRVKLWVNGLQITDFSTETYPSQNAAGAYMHFGTTRIYYGRFAGGSFYYEGYISEAMRIDNSLEDVGNFGEFKSGIWIPKNFNGTYGSAGYKLDFADSVNLGNDVSGNNNDFSTSGITTDDQVEDTPTNNFPTWNYNQKHSGVTLSRGTLGSTGNGASNGRSVIATMTVPSSIKFYFEVKVLGGNTGPNYIGFIPVEDVPNVVADTTILLANTRALNLRIDGGGYYWEGTGIGSSFGDIDQNDIIGMAIDGQGKIWHSINGVWVNSGDPAAGTGATITDLSTDELAIFYTNNSSLTHAASINFGQQPFVYTAPTGFKKLCSENLPEPDIIDGSTGIDVVVWAGNSTDDRDITDYNFQPDFVWIKNRTIGRNHRIIDSVRGATNTLQSDNAVVEYTENNVKSFLTNGYRLGNVSGVNATSENYVGFGWKKGSKYGLDILTYVGNGSAAHNIPHSLGGVPEMMIVKGIDVAQNWCTYHYHVLTKTDPETDRGLLDTQQIWADANLIWDDTAPTSTQFTVGASLGTNSNNGNFIAYLFRSIEGYCRVTSYEGNSNSDGTFVYLGFRPKFLLIKNADANSRNWFIYDTTRNPYNIVDRAVYPDDPQAEAITSSILDIYSNGFKPRVSSVYINNSGSTHIVLAFAESPFKYNNAR